MISARVDRRTHRRGFTLLELLVVLAIMAALTAVFPMALNRFVPARRVDAAARQLLADIRLAEARSVATNQPVEIVPTAHGYQLRTGSSVPSQSLSTRSWRPSTSLALHSEDESRDLAAFRVFPDGSSSGARFSIHDGERAREVIVSELTSRVRIENAR